MAWTYINTITSLNLVGCRVKSATHQQIEIVNDRTGESFTIAIEDHKHPNLMFRRNEHDNRTEEEVRDLS